MVKKTEQDSIGRQNSNYYACTYRLLQQVIKIHNFLEPKLQELNFVADNERERGKRRKNTKRVRSYHSTREHILLHSKSEFDTLLPFFGWLTRYLYREARIVDRFSSCQVCPIFCDFPFDPVCCSHFGLTPR